MVCPDAIKEYVQKKNLSSNDYLFTKTPHTINLYLRRLGEKLFGDKPSLAGQKYSEITMYDFRHISCCYWLPRYKSESALKFRFGWKKSDKIHYYSEMLGMRDTIDEEDMLDTVKKTELEQRLAKAERENELMKEENQLMKAEMEDLQKTSKLILEALEKAKIQVKSIEMIV